MNRWRGMELVMACGVTVVSLAAAQVPPAGRGQVCPAPAAEVAFGARSASVVVDAAFSGQSLMVADIFGLGVWDVSQPETPQALGHWTAPDGGSAVAVRPDGSVLLADGSGRLTVLDVSRPAVPVPVGWGALPGAPQGIAVSSDGATAYVADGTEGLQIVDLTNPESPSVSGSLGLSDFARDVAVLGQVAFVAAGSSVVAVNVADPANPGILAQQAVGGTVEGVAVEGDASSATVYVADGQGGFVVLTYDGVTPSFTQVGTADLGGWVYDVAPTAAPGYVAAVTGGRIVVVNATDPANPVEEGGVATAGYPGAVTVSGGLIAAAEGTDGFELATWSGGNPAVAGRGGSRGMIWAAAVSGGLALAADNAGGVLVEDVSDLAHPQLLTVVPTSDWAVAVAVGGARAFAAEGMSGVGILDISTPAQASEIALVDSGDAECVAASADGASAYVGGADGFTVVDGATGQVVGSIGSDTVGYVGAVAVSGSRVYATNGSQLLVIDVSTPASPQLVGSLGLSGPYAVAAEGDMAYVYDGTSIVVVDCSVPASPQQRGSVDLGAWGPPALAASGGLVFALPAQQLAVVDAADPAAPALAASVDATRLPEWVTVDDAGMVWRADMGLLHAYTVACQAPQAEFTGLVSGRRAAFLDRSLYGPAAWSWDFGDGGTATGQNPVHLYDADGTYTVTLAVSNGYGTSQIQHQVMVGTPGDLNDDGVADGADQMEVVLEIFDLDGFDPADAAGGSHPGSPADDLDGSHRIDAADLAVELGFAAGSR